MRPDSEAPLCTTDEVGMIVGDAEVVQALHLARSDHRLHLHPTPLLRPDLIAWLQLPARHPPSLALVEGMLQRRPQHPTTFQMEIVNEARPHEDLFHPLEDHWPVGIVLIARRYLVHLR